MDCFVATLLSNAGADHFPTGKMRFNDSEVQTIYLRSGLAGLRGNYRKALPKENAR